MAAVWCLQQGADRRSAHAGLDSMMEVLRNSSDIEVGAGWLHHAIWATHLVLSCELMRRSHRPE